MKYNRLSGIILHPSSLPGPDGIGDLGPEAYRWIQFLNQSETGLWQVLPLGPTGYGDSPYQCFSAFAGNPYLISPALLLEDGLITKNNLEDRPSFPVNQISYGDAIHWKLKILQRAFNNFKRSAPTDIKDDYEAFKSQQTKWINDFAIFMSIKETYDGKSWEHWDAPLRKREKKAIQKFCAAHEDNIQRHIFNQFLFFRQWNNLHQFASEQNILIIGDVPIFVAYDSADTWSNPELFFLDDEGQPTVVAGVPPDYFSPTGQLWGNPLYRWDYHKQTGYKWWIDRFQAALSMFDIIRLDHFRGFAGYWEVPANMPTAEVGEWKKGPGFHLFDTIRSSLGDLPIIAEDLGEITPDVIELREQFQLPGMKILQFAFDSLPENPFLPHNYPENCVAYTGTHDNDTSLGWFQKSTDHERNFLLKYLNCSENNITWKMIRIIWASIANMVLSPLQDFLELDSQSRMNYPGKPSGNWNWRFSSNDLTSSLADNIKEINFLFSRTKPPQTS